MLRSFTYALVTSASLLQIAFSYPFSEEISWHNVQLDLLNIDVVIDTADQQDVPYYEITNSEKDVEIKAMTISFMNGTVIKHSNFTSKVDDQHSMIYDLVLEAGGFTEEFILEIVRESQIIYDHYNRDPETDLNGIDSSDEDGENYSLDESLLRKLPPGWYQVPYEDDWE